MKPSTTKLGKILAELGVVDEPFTTYDLKTVGSRETALVAIRIPFDAALLLW
jgi:hypothetical protein